MRILIFIIVLSLCLPVFGQRNKKNEEEALEVIIPEFVEGVMYSLPQTGIRVHLKTSKTDYAPGPYARFANQFLGIADVNTQATSDWKINNVSFEVFSLPDPDQVYKAMGEIASLIGLTPNGCISGINVSASPQMVAKTVTNPVSYSGIESDFSFTNLSDMPFFSAGDSTNGFRPTRLNIEQKAVEVATRILECRNLKFELATGFIDVAPPDGKGYEASLKQLDNIEEELLSLFTGKKKSESYHFSFEYIPSANTNKGEVIFRFSEENGVLDKSDLTGKPVLIEVSKNAELSSGYERLRNSENPDAGKSGVYYRQPGMAEVKLVYELKSLATSSMAIAQYGVSAPVPELFLNGIYSLEFHPETGAIKNVIQK
ncbi:MAG: DUF4831 family protein [Mariniphaga sp.]|nr:DUF4831 family protein [Mariniphaga sp.]